MEHSRGLMKYNSKLLPETYSDVGQKPEELGIYFDVVKELIQNKT